MQTVRWLTSALRLLQANALWLLLAGIMAVLPARAAQLGRPWIEFTEPYSGRLYMAASNVPIMLRAFAAEDVILSAEVFADGRLIGVATFCCPLCPCALPPPGQETVLQIPALWHGQPPPPAEIWQGWTNVPNGTHRLTARAVSENGTVVESSPVEISVREVKLFIGANSEKEGDYVLVIPNGTLIDDGSFDLEASSDLRNWTRVGPFSPGNVAAFYWDRPPASARGRRFYRAVWVPSSPR